MANGWNPIWLGLLRSVSQSVEPPQELTQLNHNQVVCRSGILTTFLPSAISTLPRDARRLIAHCHVDLLLVTTSAYCSLPRWLIARCHVGLLLAATLAYCSLRHRLIAQYHVGLLLSATNLPRGYLPQGVRSPQVDRNTKANKHQSVGIYTYTRVTMCTAS